MLNCVYHPIDDMRVVDNEEREKLLASGFWFDSPLDAKALHDHHAEIVKEEKKQRGRPKKEENHGKND